MSVSEQDEDGFWTHRISQSWLGTALECLEKGRRGGLPDDDPMHIGWVDNDSSITGSAVHFAIQETIDAQIEDGTRWPLEWTVDSFQERFSLLLERREVYVSGGENTWEDRDDESQVVWITRRKPDTARGFGVRAVTQWHDLVFPQLDPWATEVGWGPLRLLHDDRREVLVTGTVDYLDRQLGPVDWKTSGRAYAAWEKERWSIQRTVYGWALRHRGFTNVPLLDEYPGPLDEFTFWVLGDWDKSPQSVPVSSTDEHDRWFRQQVSSLIPLMESQASVWPKLDNHVLCSPKFCEAWSSCKGADIRTPNWAQPVDTEPLG